MKNALRTHLASLLPTTAIAVASLVCPATGGQDAPQVLPGVVMIGVPTYPATARTTRIEGVVHLKVTTDGQGVAAAEVQDGPVLLAAPSLDNVRTWRFSPHDPITFIVTYKYRLTDLAKGEASIPSVVLRLPKSVEVSAVSRTTSDPALDFHRN